MTAFELLRSGDLPAYRAMQHVRGRPRRPTRFRREALSGLEGPLTQRCGPQVMW